ncbi:MAG: hypothetical protein ABIK65_07905 [Candidatus Eisenbacteria bacterium]
MTRSKLLGVFMTSMSLLAFEIALTRIFSVVLWYHFAFLAISLALFGLGAGGLLLHFFPERFPREEVGEQMARFALLFAVSIPVSFTLILGVPFVYRVSLPALVSLFLIYAFAAVPFLLGGVTLGLALSRYRKRIGVVYGYDLVGAGVGCALVVPLLNRVSGPGAVFVVALAAAAGAALFAVDGSRRVLRMAVLVIVFFAVLLGVQEGTGLFRIDFAKDELEKAILYEKWNALARVTVTDRGTVNWATSEAYQGPKPETLWLKIDAEAGTPIVRFEGELDAVRAVQYDVTALAYTLRNDVPVMIIGPGGGRDVLTALSFGYRDVTGVEINPAIIEAVRGPFGEYSGRLYDRPEVTIVAAEGRSFARRSGEKFGIIQASLIDTWAATSAGAYVLSESNLYTKEAFVDFLGRLREDGILTMSRWFFKGRPIETLRLAGVAAAALEAMGVEDPARHIMVVKRSTWDWAYRLNEFRDGVGTLLVKRTPWEAGEVDHIRRIAGDLKFDLVFAPGEAANHPDFERLFDLGPSRFAEGYPFDVSPPTDDRPFFFYMLRPADALRALLGRGGIEQGVMQNNVRAMFVLAGLLVIVLLFTAAFLMLPAVVRRGEPVVLDRRGAAFLLYFVSLGLGYLLVEIPLMQRFILYLGHPVHALSVVLFALLIGSGVGSLVSQRLSGRWLVLPPILLVAGVPAFAMILQGLFDGTLGASFAARVAIAVALLLPLAFVMGIPFPAGVRALGEERKGMVPWVWGVNGATSVMASVLATLLAIGFGFRAVLFLGAAAYAVAFLSFLVIRREASPVVRE